MPFPVAAASAAPALAPAAPYGGSGSTSGMLLPMMLFMSRTRRGSKGSQNEVNQRDPFGCSAQCASSQGYCPKPAPAAKPAALLQLEEMPLPLAPRPPLHAGTPLAPLPPALPQIGANPGAIYPMLTFMGARKNMVAGAGNQSPMLAGCVLTCQAQQGCGEMAETD